ncbi:MAG: hypothetical protein CM15mV101_510 [uncultured marine virus]|nr:MAG: hypothetical protein CM15mV101_510 [uncultured marine virus]
MFYETSCITAMESQACGLPMITTNRGALPKLCVMIAIYLLKAPTNTEEYKKAFVDGVFKL